MCGLVKWLNQRINAGVLVVLLYYVVTFFFSHDVGVFLLVRLLFALQCQNYKLASSWDMGIYYSTPHILRYLENY